MIEWKKWVSDEKYIRERQSIKQDIQGILQESMVEPTYRIRSPRRDEDWYSFPNLTTGSIKYFIVCPIATTITYYHHHLSPSDVASSITQSLIVLFVFSLVRNRIMCNRHLNWLIIPPGSAWWSEDLGTLKLLKQNTIIQQIKNELLAIVPLENNRFN